MVIQANDLSRTYPIRKKKAGLPGAVLGLFKTEYLEKRAIDHLSFTMEEGEALACIGENGAGKSTLIKMLVGILQPTSGSRRTRAKSALILDRKPICGWIFRWKKATTP